MVSVVVLVDVTVVAVLTPNVASSGKAMASVVVLVDVAALLILRRMLLVQAERWYLLRAGKRSLAVVADGLVRLCWCRALISRVSVSSGGGGGGGGSCPVCTATV